MVLTTVVGGIGTTFERLHKIERQKLAVLRDPLVLVTGSMAGLAGRAVALPFDEGGNKGPKRALQRRAPQFGILMWFYVPVSARLLPGTEVNPPYKAFTTFMIGAVAGFVMRLICNPINRVSDECLRTGDSFRKTCQIFRSKTILQFFYTTPPLMVNAVYFGTLLTVFEGLRRFCERNRILPLRVERDSSGKEIINFVNHFTVGVGHTVVGGVAAAVASTVCYPLSAHFYQQTVIHDSAICRGLMPTLRKEVPMMAVSFGVFSLLQSLLARHHGPRAGFGY
ncbi:uncharacterized protein TEOVI_000100300 [Trypanosoma equiperdum]|uniref:Mitochondrial carrier protein n=3 Tax=Trypanozoon TaxID=39700 RepID=Q584Z3_TRYB2|nr:hypothetical protein, conserved [Trypanosoma brucei gambiense DAL972]XP_845471.1 hypothetical protein, conserved [Trypanosoma brucei brucei TREU927]AAX79929.1 hypothetical protein, conserved [Trypanosoma brucei]SCU69437.1 hypothetical protein, conserved [Trypanosoma equiperdum]AAZ11912.1 hypothetical protein, conserved [Trypanosoma brucei brucei TREU927]CBH11851.1 hypothetical protein, conserved [Trypanosoma brucei gambiense DAL972]|eukprot:XP_011774136.1 hypothetical protein, conserved [Trypanosoma brucei gambiense DAL972]